MTDISTFIKQNINMTESMDSLIIYKNGMGYEVNKKADEIINVRSIAKTILALVTGIVIEKSGGHFTLDTLIFPIIKNKINLTNKKNLRYLKEIKVYHLLTHTTGFRDLVMQSKDINDKDLDKLLDYVINYPLYYKPGTYFLYSNAGYYLLAAVLEEFLDGSLEDFIEENLFKPLDIKGAKFDYYGPYLAGATKLYLKADDMVKIGKLFLNEGKFAGKEIVSGSFIKEMKSPAFTNLNETKRAYLSEDSYGLGMWISNAGIVFGSGTGGQLIVILEKKDTIIVTANGGSASKASRIKADVDKIIAEIMKG